MPSSVRKRLVGFVAVSLLVLVTGCVPTARPKPTAVIFTYVTYPILDESIAGIREGLAEHGYGPEKLTIREVNANGQAALVSSYAKEILATKPDVLIPVSTPVTQAVVKAASPQQRVVFSTVTNPADVGMDRKPANVTGVSDLVNYEGNIDLIRQLVPGVRRIAMLYNPSEANSRYAVDQLKPIMAARQLTLVLVPVSNSDEAVVATRSLKGRADALYIGSDNTVAAAIEGVVAAARRIHVPVVASDTGSVEKGALAAVSVDYHKLGREVGRLAAEVLQTGRNPGALPNVLFKGDALVINPQAARATGFTFPADILAHARPVTAAQAAS